MSLVCLSRFVSDQVTWDVDSQFLLGPAFLVSPVLEPVSMEASDEERTPVMRPGELEKEKRPGPVGVLRGGFSFYTCFFLSLWAEVLHLGALVLSSIIFNIIITDSDS